MVRYTATYQAGSEGFCEFKVTITGKLSFFVLKGDIFLLLFTHLVKNIKSITKVRHYINKIL